MLWFASLIGASVLRRLRNPDAGGNEDVRIILGATLTLLGLIIGFALSMAIGGYNARQSNEEAEALAISTEFLRADMLPADEGRKLRPLLSDYLDQRLLFYRTHDVDELQTIGKETARLQHELWNATVGAARSCSSIATDASFSARCLRHERRANLRESYASGMA